MSPWRPLTASPSAAPEKGWWWCMRLIETSRKLSYSNRKKFQSLQARFNRARILLKFRGIFLCTQERVYTFL